MLRTIRLHGELGKRFGRVHKLDVATPQEALRALMANYPEMDQFLRDSDARGIAYKCMVDGEVIGEEMLPAPMSKSFSITPVVRGAGSVLKIIAGTILAVVGVATGQMWLTAIGASMALGGVAQLLAPTPKSDQSGKQENPYFDGPAQTIAQGSSVPFGYGLMIIGSRVISAAITVSDQYTGGYAYIGGYAGEKGLSLNA